MFGKSIVIAGVVTSVLHIGATSEPWVKIPKFTDNGITHYGCEQKYGEPLTEFRCKDGFDAKYTLDGRREVPTYKHVCTVQVRPSEDGSWSGGPLIFDGHVVYKDWTKYMTTLKWTPGYNNTPCTLVISTIDGGRG